MAKLVEMPKLSPTMEEGQIATWHANEGDSIDVDDLLAEVETDKATMEFRSFDSGVLLKILSKAGSVVRLGDPVAIIGEAGENIDDLLAKASAKPAAAPATAAATAPSAPVAPESTSASAPSTVASLSSTGRVKASPYVRKLARERGLDLRLLAGSGPGGRIVARDLEGASAARTAAPAPTSQALPVVANREPEVRPLSMMRRTIAKRLTESKQNVPHFYLTMDIDAGPLAKLRKSLNADLADAPEGLKVSFNDMIIKATAIALGRVPECNASYTPTALVFHRRVDVSVAVAIDEGLVTPVVRNADTKSLLEISREVRELAGRARDRKLSSEEMTNGTFSVSNLGMYGIEEFAAVINPPEGAILAVGAIRSEPVVQGDSIVAGKRLKVTLSCDHRVVDGAVGSRWLAALRDIIERPTQILAL